MRRRPIPTLVHHLPDLLAGAAGLLARDLTPRGTWEGVVRRPLFVLGAMLATGIVLAVLVNPAVVVPCGALAGVIAVGYGWPGLTIRGLSAELRIPVARGVEGEPFRPTLAIRNGWPWPVWGVWLEGDLGDGRAVPLSRLPARSTTEFSWEVAPQRRGEYPRGAVRIVTGFPFGLASATRPVGVRRRVLVWPATVPLDNVLGGHPSSAHDDVFSDHRHGDSGDVSGTRPFRLGDSLRKVHWPLSSRTGELVSCERQAPITAAVRVVVYPDPDGHDDDGPTGTLESALRVAASVCSAYHARQARVECLLAGQRLDIEPGRRGIVRFLDSIARYEPGACRAAFPRTMASRDSPALRIVITTPKGVDRAAGVGRHANGGLVIVIEPAEHPAAAPAQTAAPHVVHLRSGSSMLDDFGARWGRLRHA